MAVQALPLNSILKRRFTVIKVIGSGAMGVVYQVHDGQDGSILAIKELSCAANPSIDKKQYEQLFRREAKILKGLSHPNLPKVIDFFEENGNLYLVMEFIDGKSLLSILEDNKGPLKEKIVLRWGITICEVLRYLHNQYPPIIFRDVKPANIIETPQGEIKLVDFGIARYYRQGQCTDTVALGSPGYAAPEQYYGKGQSEPRTDIYGLGVTLHVLLTDRDPLDTPFNFPEVSSINNAVSMKTSKTIAQATMMDPLFRFYSAADMLYSLRASSRGLTGTVSPSVMAPAQTAAGAAVPAHQASTPATPASVPPPPSSAQVWQNRFSMTVGNPIQLLALRKSNFGRAAAAFFVSLIFFLPMAMPLAEGLHGNFATIAFFIVLICLFFGLCGFFTT
ncbi:MAG: serine/threonine protein kinase [Candidatus Xenobiia bacterium LiM19]